MGHLYWCWWYNELRRNLWPELIDNNDILIKLMLLMVVTLLILWLTGSVPPALHTICLPSSLAAKLFAYLFVRLLVCSPACLFACLFVRLLVCSPACSSARKSSLVLERKGNICHLCFISNAFVCSLLWVNCNITYHTCFEIKNISCIKGSLKTPKTSSFLSTLVHRLSSVNCLKLFIVMM